MLSRDGDTTKFRLTMHPDENGKVWSWVSERTVDRARRTVRARRVDGPLRPHEHPVGVRGDPRGHPHALGAGLGRTKPEAPVDDAWMTDNINRNSRVQMELIRDRIEKVARDRQNAPMPG